MGVTPQFSLVQLAHPDLTIKMRLFLLLASVIPSLQAVCLLHSCSRWISSKSGDRGFQDACAVVFDENCCKDSKDKYMIPKNTEGQFCRSRILGGGPRGCKGTKGIRDDIESLIVRPGCTLGVWKDGSGLTNAKAAEAQGPQQGAAKHDRDMADRKKGRFVAVGNQDLIVKIWTPPSTDLRDTTTSMRISSLSGVLACDKMASSMMVQYKSIFCFLLRKQ